MAQRSNRITNVVSAFTARTQLGQILKRASERDERFMVDRRGQPSVIIMSIRDYIKNVAPTPAAYRAIRDDAKRKGTNTMSDREIEREIAAVRRRHASNTKTKQPGA
jgi:prevent-host-death family protein